MQLHINAFEISFESDKPKYPVKATGIEINERKAHKFFFLNLKMKIASTTNEANRHMPE